jgi:predicted phosphodiesterase
MAFNQPWSAADVEKAKAVLASGRHASIEAACPEIAAALGKAGLTPSSVLRGFKRAGEQRRPSEFLRPAARLAVATESVALTADRTFVERREVTGLPLSGGRTTFVISDMHIPFHDPEVWAAKLAIIKRLRPDVVVIIGDLFDFYAASSFPKNPQRKFRVIDEVNEGLPLLDQLEELRVPNVFYLEGNHEERLGRAVVSMAPQLHGMVKTLPEIARVAERGWHWVPYKRSISIGKMRFSHDFTRCGVNAARQSLLDVGKSITFGHTHRLGVAYQGTIEDGSHVALNVGHGSDLKQVDYMHRDRALRDWQHGCGIIDEDERGFVWPQAVAIIGGTARVRGQKVAA